MADRFGVSLEALGVNIPYSIEAEQAVLGAIIVDSSALDEVGGELLPEHFYQKQNGAIFKEMVLMNNSGKPIDFVTVLDAVVTNEVFPSEADAKVYLYGITQTVPTIKNVKTYKNIVYDKYIMRTLIAACRDIIDQSAVGQENAAQLLDAAEQKIYEIRNGRDSGELRRIDSVVLEVLETLNQLNGPDRDKYRGLSTGYSALDRILTGLNKSDLIILAARPAVGKTSFALNIATNVASNSGSAVAVFSLEMTKQQLTQRILSSTSCVSSQKMRMGELETDDWSEIANAASAMSKTQIFIDDTSGITVGDIKAKARRVKNLGLIIVDYLQLMRGSGKNDSRVNEISDITRSFKIMAKELNVPIILLSQLSRSNEKGARRPMLSDLRDSGSIEQDADIVMFLHREGSANETGKDSAADSMDNDITLIVAKNRHGSTAKMKMVWDGDRTTFTSMELFRSEDE